MAIHLKVRSCIFRLKAKGERYHFCLLEKADNFPCHGAFCPQESEDAFLKSGQVLRNIRFVQDGQYKN